MSDYSICVMQNPKNRTKFKRGDIVSLNGHVGGFLVVGEDDTHLHVFELDGGGYMGVFKAEPNLACLSLQRPAIGDAVITLGN